MHTVKCTQCGRSLTIPKPVVQAKIRCPACGTVFVGTSHPAGGAQPAPSAAPAGAARPPARPPAPPHPERPERPDSPNSPQPQGPPEPDGDLSDLAQAVAGAPAPAAAPARHAAPHPAPHAAAAPRTARSAAPQPATPHYVPPKSNKSLYLGLLLGFFILFLIGAVYILVSFAGKTHVTTVEANGRAVSEWLTPSQIQERKQQALPPPPPPPVVMPSPASPKPAARRGAGSGAVNPSLTQAELDAMPPGGSTEIPEVPALPEDPKITAMGFQKICLYGGADTGTIVGTVVNKYDSPLQDLQIKPQIVDSKSRIILTLPATDCVCVPTGGTARYSAKFEGVPEDMIDKIRISAKAVPMEKGMACYEVEEPIVLDPQEKTVTAAGNARNIGQRTMAEAYVQVDFYTREWIFIKSVRGALISSTENEPAGRITAGRWARFKAELTLAEGEDPQRAQKALARVVGKEE